MSTFRPSHSLRLVIRTEEYANNAALRSRVAAQSSPTAALAPAASGVTAGASAAAGAGEIRESLERLAESQRALEAQRTSLPPETYREQAEALRAERGRLQDAYSNAVAGSPRSLEPASVRGASPDDLTVVGNIQPQSSEIKRNGIQSADTATITIDYSVMPVDPRTIRSIGVELTIGVVSADDFQRGVEGARRPDGQLTSIVSRDASNGGAATRFVGFVDSMSVDWTDTGDTLVFECRDASAQLIGRQSPSGVSIDLDLPIDQGVRQYLALFPATQGVTVQYEASIPPPVPSAAMPPSRRTRRGRRARRPRRVNREMSVWDVINDTCGALGLLAFVRDWDVVISDARTVFSSTNVKAMIYGENISELSFERRLGGVKVPTIEVRAFDPDLMQLRWARFPVATGQPASGIFGVNDPPQPLRPNEVPPSGAVPDEGVKVIRVSGVTDPRLLENAAAQAFQQIGRQEISGKLTSREHRTVGAAAQDGDLLNLRAGEPLQILVRAAPLPGTDEGSSTVADIEALSVARRAQYLEQRGWPRDVARRFAQLSAATGLQAIFQVQDIVVSMDAQDGLSIDLSFANYITVREDVPV